MEISKEDADTLKRCVEFYKNDDYENFIPLALKIYNINALKSICSEFIYQSISNYYFMKKNYKEALKFSIKCSIIYKNEDNLDNLYKIINKIENENKDNIDLKNFIILKKKTIIDLYKINEKEEYLYDFCEYSFKNNDNILEIFEDIKDLKKNNSIYKISNILILKSGFIYLKYGKKYLNKLFEYKKDFEIFEQIEKSESFDEQVSCILFLTLPKLFYKEEEIDIEYERILINMRKIIELKNLKKNSIYNNILLKNNYSYYYTYFGKNIRELLELYSKLLLKIYIDLEYENKMNKIINTKKIKIGFLSNFIFKNHSVSKDRLGIIKHLCMDKDYEVFLIHFDTKKEKEFIFEKIMNNIKFNDILIFNNVKENCDIISNLNLDILVFPEIGMDMDIYIMSYSKLAPIQINTWGHSETSGNKNIDYYISSEYFETENSQHNYSEKLIKLKSLSTYYYDNSLIFNEFISDIEKPNFLKDNYEIYSELNLYGIFQTVFKYHPKLMNIIKLILLKDPKAFFIVFINKSCKKDFMEYAYELIGFNCSRIKLIDSMPNLGYCNLLKTMDVLIDSYPFGGCNTSLDAFFFNKIVLTLPSDKLNGRFTYGFYKKMNIEEPICSTAEELVNKAIYYMTNEKERKKIEELISKRKYRIFKEKESLLEWNNQIRNILNFPLRKEKSRKIIISRFKENIEYVDYYFPNENVLIYNKGDDIENKNILKLKNVGKCDHTYLYHIIENYNNLDDINVFLPASFMYINIKKDLTEKLFEYINMTNNEKSCFVGKYNHNIIKENYEFTLLSYETFFSENKNEKINNETELSEIRPYGKWLEHIFERKEINGDFINYFGIIAITKEDILKYPLEFYKKLFSYVQTSNPEAGHFIERSYSLFFPHEKEQFINY